MEPLINVPVGYLVLLAWLGVMGYMVLSLGADLVARRAMRIDRKREPWDLTGGWRK